MQIKIHFVIKISEKNCRNLGIKMLLYYCPKHSETVIDNSKYLKTVTNNCLRKSYYLLLQQELYNFILLYILLQMASIDIDQLKFLRYFKNVKKLNQEKSEKDVLRCLCGERVPLSILYSRC